MYQQCRAWYGINFCSELTHVVYLALTFGIYPLFFLQEVSLELQVSAKIIGSQKKMDELDYNFIYESMQILNIY